MSDFEHVELWEFLKSVKLLDCDEAEKYNLLEQNVEKYCSERDRKCADNLSALTELPLYEILHYLSATDLSRLSQTCTRMRDLCRDNVFWINRTKAQILAYELANDSTFAKHRAFYYTDDKLYDLEGLGRWLMYPVRCIDFLIEKAIEICPEISWKWWYLKFRKVLYGNDDADSLASLPDLDDILYEYDCRTGPLSDRWLGNRLMSFARQYRIPLKHRIELSFDKNEKTERSMLYNKLNRYPHYLYKFSIDQCPGTSIMFSEQTEWIMIVTAESEVELDCSDVFDGTLIHGDFTWEGKYLSFDEEFRTILDFDSGCMTFKNCGLKVDCSPIKFLKMKQSGLNYYPIYDLIDIEQFSKIMHPAVLEKHECYNYSHYYPQQLIPCDDGEVYCLSCFYAECSITPVRRKTQYSPTHGFIWRYTFDDVVMCSCSESVCKIPEQKRIELAINLLRDN